MNSIDLKFKRLDRLKSDIKTRYKDIYEMAEEEFNPIYFKSFLEDIIKEVKE